MASWHPAFKRGWRQKWRRNWSRKWDLGRRIFQKIGVVEESTGEKGREEAGSGEAASLVPSDNSKCNGESKQRSQRDGKDAMNAQCWPLGSVLHRITYRTAETTRRSGTCRLYTYVNNPFPFVDKMPQRSSDRKGSDKNFEFPLLPRFPIIHPSPPSP